mmetsp:Transcript_130647/g.317320  ORF Transcript_130647/g.317320 Transcript_130647/m.317320 type:complete len:236 (+) Transcript_130647:213-920(+)
MHHDLIRHLQRATHLALRVIAKHDLDLDAEHTLPHRNVPYCLADVVLLGLARGDEVAVLELHGLGALRAQLAADDDLAARRAVLHDEAHDAVASPAHGEATKELVPQGLRLCHGTGCAILDALREEFNAVLWEAKALLDHSGEFPNAAAFLAQDLARASRTDDDFRADGSDTDLDAGVAILRQCAHQELIQLRVKHAIRHKLALLGDLALVGHGWSGGLWGGLEGEAGVLGCGIP